MRIKKVLPLALMLSGWTNAQAQESSEPLTLSGHETQSAHVVDLATGKTLVDYNGQKRLTPASTTKIFSTGAALLTHGAHSRMTTAVGYDKTTGELIFHGAFDPTGDSRYTSGNKLSLAVDTICQTLKKMGVTRVTVVADVSRGLATPYNNKRIWEDMGNYYGAAPTCLMANDNIVDIHFATPSKAGALCEVTKTEPDVPQGTPQCYVTTYEGQSDQCNIFLAGDKLWYATGELPKGRTDFVVKSAMPSPVEFYLNKMATMLKAKGIEVVGTKVSDDGAKANEKRIGTIYSPSIAEVAAATNSMSLNHFADALMMSLTKHEGHTSWDEAVQTLKNFWKQKGDLDLHIYDGSGLSPANEISAREMTTMLTIMHKSAMRETFMNTLPVAGKSGTLKTLGAKTNIEGRVHAKSGSMTRVLTYAGYMKCKSGKTVAFAVMVNHMDTPRSKARNAIASWLNGIWEAY